MLPDQGLPPRRARSELDIPGLSGLRLGLLCLFALVAARLAWVSDDAFISFRTVQNLVSGDGMTWNPDERVQAFTNPLWMFLITTAYFCTREIFLTTIVASILVAGAAVAVVLTRLCTSLPRCVALVAILLSSQAVLEYATSGLENPLSYLLVAVFCSLWLESRSSARPIFRLFFVGALLVLNRQDLVLLVAPALGMAWLQSWSWRSFRLILLGLAPILAWEVFSVIYYGFPFPNTYYAKLNTGVSAHEYFAQGLVFLLDLLSHDPATLLVVVVAIGVSVGSLGRHQLLPLGAGLLLYLYYTVSVGGDFMQGRFLAVPAFMGAIVLTQGLVGQREHLWQPLVLAAVVLAASSLRFFLPVANDPPVRISGVADERRFYADSYALTNFVRGLNVPDNHPRAALARAMRDNRSEHVFVTGDIGMQGWLAGPKVHIVDYYGLSDPFIARISAITPWRIGHFQRVVPNEYLESLRTGQNHLHSARLARLYDQLQLVTRGPLFRWDRIKAIWDLNIHPARINLNDADERLDLSIVQLSERKADGYPWNGPGTFQIYPAGADIDLGTTSHATSLALSADNNDRYRMQFMARTSDGLKSVGEVMAGELVNRGGLANRELGIPGNASNKGFDVIRILPEGGDGLYAVGSLVLQGDAGPPIN